MIEAGDKLVTSLSCQVSISGQRGSYYEGFGSVVNIYDSEMKLLSEQAYPGFYRNERRLSNSLSVHDDKLYLISTDNQGPEKINCLFSVLNISSGKWESMEWLINKKVDRDDYVGGKHTMWFKNHCIIPYESPKGFMIRSNTEITLLQKAL